MTNKEKIKEIVNEVIWEYITGEARCKECLVYRFMASGHEKDCLYGQILRVIEETEWDDKEDRG